MAARGIKRNFTGGEVHPAIEVRDDYEKYRSACRQMTNFIPQVHGAARLRCGTRFIRELPSNGALKPFKFNTDLEDQYCMVFTNTNMYFAQGGAMVGAPYNISTPYAAADVLALQQAQLGDKVYLAHTGYAPQVLTRSGHTSWAIAAMVPGTTVTTPVLTTVTWNGAAGTTTIKYKAVFVADDGDASAASTANSTATGQPPSFWVVGNNVDLTATVNHGATTGTMYFYKERAGMYGFIGRADTPDSAVADGGAGAGYNLTFTLKDMNYTPDASDAPTKVANPFASSNHPGSVCIHQQRLLFAGSNDNPRTFWGSRTGLYENFNMTESVLADDAYTHVLASGSVDRIQWMLPFGDLLIGTAGAEHVVKGEDEGAVTYSATAKPQTYWGSEHLMPLVIGDTVLHVQRGGTKVRNLAFSLAKDGYAGSELTVLAKHLFEGRQIVDWTYQQEPDPVIWVVLDNGDLLGFSYLEEHKIWGWFAVDVGGKAQSVCALPGEDGDLVYVIVEREINEQTTYYLEYFEPIWRAADGIEKAFFVDSGASYDGWNATSTSLMTLTTATDWEAGETLTLTASGVGHTPFSAGSVGAHYKLRSGDDYLTVVITAYTSSTVVSATSYSDIPTSLQAATADWALMTAEITSGLGHLEGEAVVALVDGVPVDGLTVDSGEVSFDFPGADIHVGLPYTGVLAPLPFSSGEDLNTAHGLPFSFGEILVRVYESVGGKAGSGLDALDPLQMSPSSWGEPVQPHSGILDIAAPADYGTDLTLYVVQDQPLPLTVLAVVADIVVGGPS